MSFLSDSVTFLLSFSRAWHRSLDALQDSVVSYFSGSLDGTSAKPFYASSYPYDRLVPFATYNLT